MVETLQAALEHAAHAGAGRGLTFLDRDETETRLAWHEVLERASAFAGGLRARGVREGRCVGIVLPTGPAFFDAFLGAMLAGAVPVPLYPPARLGRLREYAARTAAMLSAVDAALVVTDKAIWPLLGEAVERAKPTFGTVLADRVRGPATFTRSRAGALALVQFSSGTTTEPKPVALTHGQVLANVRAILGRIREVPGTTPTAVSWLPLYHDMGLIGCVCSAVVEAGALTLIGPETFLARPALWLRALSRTRASVSAAPNFAYGLCADRIPDEDLDGVDLSAWRLALNGAEPVSPVTLRRFARRFGRWGFRPEAITPVYGLAEATLAVAFASPGAAFRTLKVDRDALANGTVQPADDGVEVVSVGKPLDGVEVDAPEGRVGPVRVRGPSVMRGYLHQPARTAKAVVNGWLATGDLGFFHDGELYLTGREKDTIVLRGANHAPQSIERAVDEVEGVRVGCSAAVGWRPEGGERERLAVLVEVRTETPDLQERCRRAVATATGLVPDDVVLLAPGTLPRTSSGKVRRAEALRRWLAGELAAPERVDVARLAGMMGRGTLAHLRARLAR